MNAITDSSPVGDAQCHKLLQPKIVQVKVSTDGEILLDKMMFSARQAMGKFSDKWFENANYWWLKVVLNRAGATRQREKLG